VLASSDSLTGYATVSNENGEPGILLAMMMPAGRPLPVEVNDSCSWGENDEAAPQGPRMTCSTKLAKAAIILARSSAMVLEGRLGSADLEPVLQKVGFLRTASSADTSAGKFGISSLLQN
jgi:hypothetical protein